MQSPLHFVAIAACLACTGLSAQNLVPNGHFDQAATGWTMTQFNDPLGTTGFAPARVTGNGPSMAVFGNFQTLTPVMSVTYRTAQTFLPPVPLPLSFDVMWEKQVTMPIPQPSVNRVEFRVYDAANTMIHSVQQPSPNQTGLIERASFTGTYTPPAAAMYTIEIFLRHSNLATIPFTCRVDNIVLGTPNSFTFGTGCAGSGSFVPVIGSSNAPLINTTNFQIELNDGWGGPTVAILALDFSNTSVGGIPLPFSLGGGCNLRVGTGALLVNLLTGGAGPGTGAAAQLLAVPNNPGITGLWLFSQWGVSDPASPSPLQVTTSAGFAFLIQ
jgi:hypothetical protein